MVRYIKPIPPGPTNAPIKNVMSMVAMKIKITAVMPVIHLKKVSAYWGNSFHSQYSIPDFVNR